MAKSITVFNSDVIAKFDIFTKSVIYWKDREKTTGKMVVRGKDGRFASIPITVCNVSCRRKAKFV